MQAVASLQFVGLFAFDKAQIAFEDPDLLVNKKVALAWHGNTSVWWELDLDQLQHHAGTWRDRSSEVAGFGISPHRLLLTSHQSVRRALGVGDQL